MSLISFDAIHDICWQCSPKSDLFNMTETFCILFLQIDLIKLGRIEPYCLNEPLPQIISRHVNNVCMTLSIRNDFKKQRLVH